MKDNKNENSVENLINNALDNIKHLIDCNVIVGEPVVSPNGNIIIPLGRTFIINKGDLTFKDSVAAEPNEDEESCEIPIFSSEWYVTSLTGVASPGKSTSVSPVKPNASKYL